MSPVHLFHIAYSQQTLEEISPGYLLLNNVDSERNDWREYCLGKLGEFPTDGSGIELPAAAIFGAAVVGESSSDIISAAVSIDQHRHSFGDLAWFGFLSFPDALLFF